MNYKPLCVSLAVGFVLIFLALSGAFYTWNVSLTDNLYGGKTALSSIKIIAIDDASLHDIGRWPWDRAAYIPILNATQTARVVGFDIAFFEATADDERLANAMRENKNVVLAEEHDFERSILLTPAPAFNEIQTGIVNVFTDSDGVTRSIPRSLENRPSFALRIAERMVSSAIDAPQKVFINFVGAPRSYQMYSAADVISGRVSADTFTNSIVLIGATAPDLHDDYIVPTSEGKRMSGVEIHANAIQTILTKQFISYQSLFGVIAVVAFFSLVCGIVYSRYKIRFAVIIVVLMAVGYLSLAFLLFERGIILNLIYPAYTLVFCSLATVSFIASYEARHRKRIHALFGRYVSKDVVEHLLADEKAIDLGGVEREVTSMFADIRGFTALSEKMTPHEVIRMLNHYFGDITDKVFEYDGTLDKFVGDALFAIWGSPLPDKDHAFKAVSCALTVVKTINSKHIEGIPPINLGIGICSGPAVVGNMGSAQRQEFTALGDTINTSSRLSGVASGGQVIITDSTYQLVKDAFTFKKLEPLKVKGKEKPLIVYEVTGKH